jgi:hypothetical protein
MSCLAALTNIRFPLINFIYKAAIDVYNAGKKGKLIVARNREPHAFKSGAILTV